MNHLELARPVETRHHMAQAVSLHGLRSDLQKVNGFNAKFAVTLTNLVGSMWCAYLFSVVALVSLPAILTAGNFVSKGTFPGWLVSVGLISLVAWVAQTFLQLVLLSVIMVGQNVQSLASDVRSQHTYDDTVEILDRLDITTAGGIRDLADRIDGLEAAIAQHRS